MKYQAETDNRPTFVSLLVNTFAVFALITFILIVTDTVPEPVSDDPTISLVAQASTESTPDEGIPESPVPVRIVIDDIAVDTSITNPESTDIDVLDRALLAGAVRYPGSGDLGTASNILIFGHSSYLPIVHNKAYQAFNELQKLTSGSVVTLYSDTHRYTYEVTDVRLARAEETLVTFAALQPTLTLATCNTFGATQERWVVTSTLVKTEEL